jgi:hypothetical protein
VPEHESAYDRSQAVQTPLSGPQAPTERVVLQTVRSQQPLGQDVGSQTHPPFTQRCPAVQAVLPVPQTQPAVGEQRSTRSPVQAVHAAPGLPQVESVRLVQTPPLQQPEEHDVESQTQPLPPQRCPALHSGPVPQRQSPLLEQALASVGLQVEQVSPPAPHAVAVGTGVQRLPTQHPVEHEVESHTQLPPAHRWPTVQTAPLGPHSHTPALEQRSARAVSQLLQAAPGPAQVAIVIEVQVAPAQQPLLHETASHLHCPPMQRCPFAQSGTHSAAPPPIPPPIPPPAPPPAPPSIEGQATRQYPSVAPGTGQHVPRSPKQSRLSSQRVSPTIEGSEQ